MRQKTGDDRVVLKEKLQDIEREWKKVCLVSVERQDCLEQVYSLACSQALTKTECLVTRLV